MTKRSRILAGPEGIFYLGWAIIFACVVTWIAWRSGDGLGWSIWPKSAVEATVVGPRTSIPPMAPVAATPPVPPVAMVSSIAVPQASPAPAEGSGLPEMEIAAHGPPVPPKDSLVAEAALLLNGPVRKPTEADGAVNRQGSAGSNLAEARRPAGLPIPAMQPRPLPETTIPPAKSETEALPYEEELETPEVSTDTELQEAEAPEIADTTQPEAAAPKKSPGAPVEVVAQTPGDAGHTPQFRVSDLIPEGLTNLEAGHGLWDDPVVEVPQRVIEALPRLLNIDAANWRLPEATNPSPLVPAGPGAADQDGSPGIEDDAPQDPSPTRSPSPPRLIVTDEAKSLGPGAPSQSAEPAPAADRTWPEMPALTLLLERLQDHNQSAAWASQVEEGVRDLRENSQLGTASASGRLATIDRLLADGPRLAQQMGYDWAHTDLMQTYFALKRRLDVWRTIHTAALSGIDPGRMSADPNEIVARLDEVEDLLRDGGQLLSWGDFLRLAELRAAAVGPQPEASLPQISREVSLRLESPDFDAPQQRLLGSPPFQRLTAELEAWNDGQITIARLLQVIENYEEHLTAGDAARLARLAHHLRYHRDPLLRQVGGVLDHTYRNANFRVFVHADLLQAMLPDMEPDERPINDTILGARVLGRSRSVTQLTARTVPDAHQWRVQLEVNGVVDSNTSSESGPVKVFNRGRSRYVAVKQVAVGPQGFYVSRAQARAATTTDVANLQTDYDGIPLLGSLVRNVARGQTDAKRPQAEVEVQNRVKSQAERQLEQELNEKVEFWQEKLFGSLIDPLQGLGLDPSVIQMQTTEVGLVGRFRTADQRQLSAHTPRPSAPAGSLMSVQFHETTINNLIEKLHLHGRTFTPEQFIEEAGKLFPNVTPDPDEPLPDDVEITFAQEAPVSVRLEDGRAKLTLRLERFTLGNQSWTDLEVSALYSPDEISKNAKLSRESTVFLTGHRLGFRDQLALRAVFLKVLSKRHAFPVLPEAVATDARLAKYSMNQLAIHEGWFAFALTDSTGSRPPRHRVTEEPTGRTAPRR